MRIGLVCPYDLDRPGGVQAQVTGLAHHLRGRGHDIAVIGPGAAADRTVGRVLAVPANGSVAPVGIGRIGAALADLDLVHVHEPLQPLGWAAMGAGLPTVATFHADAPGWVRLLTSVASPVIARRLRGAVPTAVSEVAADAWGRVVDGMRIVPNGVDAPAVGSGTRSGVVFVGRDEPRKGLDTLFASWPAVRATRPDVELVVVGTDREGGLGTRSLGRLTEEEKWHVLGDAAIACVPNVGAESFGIVLVEAMAAGCAVVASDLPAFRAVAGDHAVWVRPGDTDGLAQAMGALLDDDGARRALAESGRRHVERYRWEVVADAYEAAYQEARATA